MITKTIRLGRLLTRPVDHESMRTGVNTYHDFQRILFTDPVGAPQMEVCLVRLDPELKPDVQERAVISRMKLLHLGLVAHEGLPTSEWLNLDSKINFS